MFERFEQGIVDQTVSIQKGKPLAAKSSDDKEDPPTPPPSGERRFAVCGKGLE